MSSTSTSSNFTHHSIDSKQTAQLYPSLANNNRSISCPSNGSNKLEKLRIIKPFDERQLLNFYRNQLLDNYEKFVRNFLERYYLRGKDHNDYYDLIIRLDKSVERFKDIRNNVDSFIEQIRQKENQAWNRTEHCVLQADRCGDGQLVESKHQYERYHLDQECAKTLEKLYYLLKERLINEHVVHCYSQKYFQLRFELVIYEACDIIQRLEKKIDSPSSNELNSPPDDDLITETSTKCDSSVFDDDTGTQVYVDPECRMLKEQLWDLFAALFAYYRQTVNQNEKLKIHCYQAIVHLAKEMSRISSFHDRLYLLIQILQCPAGSSNDFVKLIEPMNPLPYKNSQYELGRQYVDYGVAVITTILSPIKHRTASNVDMLEKDLDDQIEQSSPIAKRFTQNKSEPWLLVDNDLEDEVVNSSLADLTENDLITYLSRVPFREMLQFMSLINPSSSEHKNGDEIVSAEAENEIISSTETAMIRLFAFNTRLIQIFRNGLQNFNCLRFKKLTLYLASMIKQIIKTISDNWRWCKEKFTTKDQALLIRLQVEFDHFMLRSIMAILSTNRRGVWPLLAKIDFEGISEPMLWHILWVVYNNGRNEQNEMASGLCPYMSANYWKDKFRNHVQWKFVFIEKLSILSLEEAGGLIDFFYNMAISRSTENETSMTNTADQQGDNGDYGGGGGVGFINVDHQNDDFLHEIVERLGEICLLKKVYNHPPSTVGPSGDSQTSQILTLNNQEFYSTKGVACLIKLVERFKSMLIVLLQFIQSIDDESNLLIQPCFDLFDSIMIDDWKPDAKFMSILYKWLVERSYQNVYNRFARILLTKIGWNRVLMQNEQCLMIPVQQQQVFALKIYQSLERNFKTDSSAQKNSSTANNMQVNKYPVINRWNLQDDQRLQMAQSDNLQQFGLWCWSMLLSIRLHPLDLVPDESCWDDIIYYNEQQKLDKYANKQRMHWTMKHMTKFNYDSEMIPVAKGIDMDNPYAIYIGAMMSDLLFHGNSTIDLKKLAEMNENLVKHGHFLPTLQLLYHFLPFALENDGELRANNALIDLVVKLIQNGFDRELISIILLQRKHFSDAKHSQQVCQSWTELLFECVNRCLNLKNSSLLSSLVPQFLLSSSTSNAVEAILWRITFIFDTLFMELLIENDSTLKLYQQYLTRKLFGRMINWKLAQIDSISSSYNSSTSSSSSWLSSWYSNDNSIVYLPDKSVLKSPWMTPLHLLLRHYLNTRKTSSSQRDQPQPVYLAFLLAEMDIRRTYHIWNHLIVELNKKMKLNHDDIVEVDLELVAQEIANACRMYEKAVLPVEMLPINLLTVCLLKFVPIEQNQLMVECPHPLIPLLWRQFFSLYFIYTDSLSTIGNRLIEGDKLKALIDRLNALFDYHNQRWIRMNQKRSIDSESISSELISVNNMDGSNETGMTGNNSPMNNSDSISALMFEDRLLKLYRAYRIWLKDNRFQRYADLDDEQFSKPEIQIKLLSSIVASSKVSNHHQLTMDNLWPEFDYINSFFFLNYVNKTPLLMAAKKWERLWTEMIKPAQENDQQIFNDDEDDDEGIETRKIQDASSNEIDFIVDHHPQQPPTSISNKILEELVKNDRFEQIIDYFNKLCSTLNCKILFIENDMGYNMGYHYDDDNDPDITVNKSEQDISVVFVIIHQIVDNVVEEARFVENQLEKYSTLNQEFLKDILPKLYHDVSKDFVQKVPCERAEFDATGCTKPATIKFEFIESMINSYIKQKYDRNRTEFESIIASLMDDIPGQKVVASIYFMQKTCQYLPRFFDGEDAKSELNQKRIKRLFDTMSGWINSINLIGIKYHITGQLLDIFLELLNKLSNQFVDEVNYFYLNTALQRSVSLSMTQQLAPCLTPSKTSPLMFIEMYKLIGERLNTTSSQQTIFVLLSKFDVSGWLQMPNLDDEKRLELLNCLFQCFAFFGTNPSDEFLVTYDLYRKHLQDMILYRFPLFMPHIINLMLQGMAGNVLAPALWNSILHTFGFYTKSLSFANNYRQQQSSPVRSLSASLEANNEQQMQSDVNGENRTFDGRMMMINKEKLPSVMDFDYQTFDEDLRTYFLRQKLFTSHELYDLLQMMIDFKSKLQEELTVEFLDHFKIYNVKFLQFLTFISYCWINSNATALPDDLSIVWLPFFQNWKFWIFPKHNTKFIQWEHLCFTWQMFINCVRFMLDSFYDGQSQILSYLWQPFLTFILETRSVEQTDVEMFESKLLQLNNWSQFCPSMIDMKLMYESVLMKRYSLEKLNAFIISKINWHQVLLYSPMITMENAVEILENLTYTIISLAHLPFIADVDFNSIPFMLLPCEQVRKIVMTLLEVMKKRISVELIEMQEVEKFKDPKPLRRKDDVTNQLSTIMRLLKALVELNTGVNENGQPQPENYKRSSKVICYAHCISSFVSFICNQNVDYVARNPDSIRMFLKDSIEALRPTIDSFESEDRISIFSELLQALNEIHDQAIRDKLTTQFITIFSYLTSHQMFAEIIFAIGKIIFSIKTSVYLLECLLENYFDLSGDLNYLVQNLEIVHLNKHLQSGGGSQSQPSNNPAAIEGNGTGYNEIEDFILETIKTRSCLLLLVYIHRRLRHRTVPDICTRKYIYGIMVQCANSFKFGNSVTNYAPFDEAKICFFWTHLFDLLTFDHSSINDELNISIHHLSSLKSLPKTSISPIPSSCSLIDSPIVYSQIASPSSGSGSSANQLSSSLPSIASSPSLVLMNNHPNQLTLDIHNEDVSNAIQTLLSLCRTLNSSISDSMNRRFFGIFKQHKQPSHSFLFLLQSLTLHGVCSMLETFFPEFEDDTTMDGPNNREKTSNSPISSPSKTPGSPLVDNLRNKLKSDLIEMQTSSHNRLRGWRKNKSFQELATLIDKIIDSTKPLVITINQNDKSVNSHHSMEDGGKNVLNINEDNDDVSDSVFSLTNDNDANIQIDLMGDNSLNVPEQKNVQSMEIMKRWLLYYIKLSQYQQKRFHMIKRWLLEFYNGNNYMKHFS